MFPTWKMAFGFFACLAFMSIGGLFYMVEFLYLLVANRIEKKFGLEPTGSAYGRSFILLGLALYDWSEMPVDND